MGCVCGGVGGEGCVCVWGGWRDEGVRGVCVCHTFCVHDITDTDLGTLKLPLVLLLLYILSLCVCVSHILCS